MPIIKPFKAVRYNKDKISDISNVVAPPYDIIPKDMQEELYRRDPHNIVRLILNKITPGDDEEDNRYTRSMGFFNSWLEDDILVRDRSDSVYIYTQKYKRGKTTIEQVGFIALMGLEDSGKDKVLPHENTLAAPKEDRLNLMRSVKANLSPIFVLHDDKPVTKALKSFCAKNKPIVDLEYDGVEHMVWRADDPKIIKCVVTRMKKKNVFIADGHHRFETAKNFCREVQASRIAGEIRESSKYIMVYFVESDERMLTVLPAHRLIKDMAGLGRDEILKRLGRYFKIEKAAGLDAMMLKLGKLSQEHAFGMYPGGGAYYVITLKSAAASDKAIKRKPKEWKRLDVSILHLFVFQHVLGVSDSDENIEFYKDPVKTAGAVDRGDFALAFFLNPTRVSQVKKIAKLGERMPRKATYFYPKQLSGLVINKF